MTNTYSPFMEALVFSAVTATCFSGSTQNLQKDFKYSTDYVVNEWELAGIKEYTAFSYAPKISDNGDINILMSFANKVTNQLVAIDPEISKIIEEKYWDML